MKTVHREVHKLDIHGKAVISKPLVMSQRQQQWCEEHTMWTANALNRVMWSDESTTWPFPTAGHVYIRRTPSEVKNSDCLLPIMQHGGSVMLWWSYCVFRRSLDHLERTDDRQGIWNHFVRPSPSNGIGIVSCRACYLSRQHPNLRSSGCPIMVRGTWGWTFTSSMASPNHQT